MKFQIIPIDMADSLHSLSPSEMLAQTVDNESVAFKFFDEKVGKFGPSAVYCFVEGYDAPYYSTRVEITDSQSRRAEFINCGGKKGVVDTCGYIAGKPAYKKFVTLYFVDKDYDDNSALSDKIFVTDGYSVENYYASDRCVRSAIKGLAAIPVDREGELDKVMQWYNQWKSEFLDATKLFCAWYANTKNRPDRKLEKDNYKKSFPKEYASLSSAGIQVYPYSISQLNTDYGLINPVTQQEVDKILPYIVSLNDIRGKYVFQLVEEFLDAVRYNSQRNKKYLTKPFDFTKNRNALLTNLSGSADTSAKLKAYLHDNL